ncbi:hypothetical protein CEXT_67821 [Caerostris extrusa]|uniref:Uncharacterized protein n=1 Tax=Caerostris extrusa TaxID=172846 RepID=A0AAV4P2U6_CAEEX|nr:hypothetical protein CEXT_67821 [Caerostris extrusa]
MVLPRTSENDGIRVNPNVYYVFICALQLVDVTCLTFLNQKTEKVGGEALRSRSQFSVSTHPKENSLQNQQPKKRPASKSSYQRLPRLY